MAGYWRYDDGYDGCDGKCDGECDSKCECDAMATETCQQDGPFAPDEHQREKNATDRKRSEGEWLEPCRQIGKLATAANVGATAAASNVASVGPAAACTSSTARLRLLVRLDRMLLLNALADIQLVPASVRMAQVCYRYATGMIQA